MTTVTGEMHSVNKANFGIMHWFGLNFAPRFTSLQAQLPRRHCGNDIGQYEVPNGLCVKRVSHFGLLAGA